MDNQRNVSTSPHVRNKLSTSMIMFVVIIALLPASVFGIYNFGYKAAIVILACISSCVLSEYLYEKILKLPITIGDLSAVVTGLLLALNLPCDIPWWICVIGSVFAIIIVKMLFGGLGQNFMNPALAARCFLLICFTARMTSFTFDGVATATPLALIKSNNAVNLMDMFIGRIPGTIGETSALMLLIGGIFLIITGVIDFRIPLFYFASFIIFIGMVSGNGWDINYIAAQLCGGGLMLGAFFMATDYVTSPITKKGKIIYGICLGLMTGLFRCKSSSAEGVSYAIIICNLLVPLIEKITVPKCFGKGGEF